MNRNSKKRLLELLGPISIVGALVGIIHYMLNIFGVFGPLVYTQIWGFGGFRLVYASNLDLEFYIHFTLEIAIRFSAISVLLPSLAGALALRYSLIHRSEQIMVYALPAAIVTAMLFLTGGYLSPLYGTQIIGIGIIPIFAMQFWLISIQRNESRIVTGMTLYWISFYSLLIGDILAGIKNDVILEGVLGGWGSGDVLWLYPLLFFAFGFYRKNLGFFRDWREAVD
ncbi:MAG: hypothetical protein ACW97O_11995 [Candidatus Thorarchaeota archaeon]